MPRENADYLRQFIMAQIHINRADIVRVWKEEGPTRTPLVSFNFTDDPNGVMVVGKRCLDVAPGNTRDFGIYVAESKSVVDGQICFGSRWEEAIALPARDEDAVACIFVPQGDAPKGEWVSFGMKEELVSAEGTVFERLVQTVKEGLQ
ncbi:hypothetical protein DFH07DRAFT_965381 [Mycena maculata]|uniref:Uncharacterized protein n=1 Tax=Mycena maculata TaxID=230809 RepID=A0AAD7IEI4_9AGAR|nr:hypothetical protein DFH07DRAFT_965381 [Mycena maculata]